MKHEEGSDREYDVIVIGAGLVGLALAAGLAHAGLSVVVADRTPMVIQESFADADDWDVRVYAVSPGSAQFLQQLGVWQQLAPERIAAIETMEVRGDADGALSFSAYELDERALAWIVEARELHAALVRSVRTDQAIDIVAPVQPESLSWSADATSLMLADGRTLVARLAVGADGVQSWARKQAGLTQQPRRYGQSAVVANFSTELAHRGRAFQWFLSDGGVLAWLPLPGRRISMVWSAPEALARELSALDALSLAKRVADTGHEALGALAQITTPAT